MNDINNPNQIATLVQVATMYYEQNLSQQQIADEMQVSRSLVALYLKKAREAGIVKIEIINPQDTCEDLALIIQNKTGLNRVIVVPGSHTSDALTRRSIAGALARHLENTLQKGDCVGIGFGRTMAEVADLLVPSKPCNIDVVPLVGESSTGLIGTYSQINLHVLKIARAFGGAPHFLLAPLMLNSAHLQLQLLEDNGIRSTTQYWDQLTHICVGVGTLPPVSGEVIYIGEENLPLFLNAGGVGDVCSRYFDTAGNFIDAPLYNRLIGIHPKQMRKAEHFLAVASGAEKAGAVSGLLRSGLVTELFVDEELAHTMVNTMR